MSTTTCDYLIVGGGPAGLQMGYFLEQSGRDYLILERGSPGEFFRHLPRHRRLISINKVETGYDDPEINLRWDWNSLLSDNELLFKDYSDLYFPDADDLVRYLEDFAETFDLRMRCDEEVTRVSRDEDGFRVETGRGVYRCRRLIMATGVSEPHRPDIPGIDLTENYVDVSIDPEDFRGQRVLLLGKGNSAFELANGLIGTTSLIHIASPQPIQMAWKTHHVGHLRALNNNFLDTYQLKSQNAVLDCTVKSIEKTDGEFRVEVSYTHADGEEEVLHYDRVICATGFRFDDSVFAADCRPDMAINGRFPAQTEGWESTNVPDLFFAGTIMQVLDYKKVTSSFIHGFRYNLRALDRLFGMRYHDQPWPGRSLPLDRDAVVEAIMERINRTSALWQQFGFLGDVLLLDPEEGEVRYLEEMPLGWVHGSEMFDGRDYLTVTLEFGKVTTDPFNIPRHPTPEQAERSTFLHPVVRRFHGGTELGGRHLLENLFGEWKDEELHKKPLVEFVENSLPSGVAA